MMPRVRCRSPLAAVAVLLPGLLTTAIMTGSRVAAEALPAARAADEAAIRAAAKTYVEALDKGDAAALAALWTPDGDIIDAGGHVMAGRIPRPGRSSEFRKHSCDFSRTTWRSRTAPSR